MQKNIHTVHWFNLLVLFCLLGASCTPLQQTTPGPVTPSSASTATATLPTATTTPEPSVTPVPVVSVGNFQSDGMLEQGWYWLKDSSMASTAEWTLNDLPAQPASINLKMKALATDANSTSGLWSKFTLSIYTAGSGKQEQLLGQQAVVLPNTSSESDLQGYTCTGTVPLDSSLLPAGVSSISITASRSAESYSDLSVDAALNYRLLYIFPFVIFQACA